MRTKTGPHGSADNVRKRQRSELQRLKLYIHVFESKGLYIQQYICTLICIL